MKKFIINKMAAVSNNGHHSYTNGSTTTTIKSYHSNDVYMKEAEDEETLMETPTWRLSSSPLITTNLTQLPDEVLIQVLKKLNFNERTSFARVNRRLSSVMSLVWLQQSSFAVKFGNNNTTPSISSEDHLEYKSLNQILNFLSKTPNLTCVSFVGLPAEIIKFLSINCPNIINIYTDDLFSVQVYVDNIVCSAKETQRNGEANFGVSEKFGVCENFSVSSNKVQKITLSDVGERVPSLKNYEFLHLKCLNLKELHLGQFSNFSLPTGTIAKLNKITTTESNYGNSFIEIIMNGIKLKSVKCYHSLTEPEIRLIATTPMRLHLVELSASMDAKDFNCLIEFKSLKSLNVQLIQGTRSANEIKEFLSINGRQLNKLEIIQCPSKGRDVGYYQNLAVFCPNLKYVTIDTVICTPSTVILFKNMSQLVKVSLQETGIENYQLLNLILSTSRKIEEITFNYMKDEGHHTSNYSLMPSDAIIDLLNEYGYNRRKGYCIVLIDGQPWNNKLPDKCLQFIFST